MRWVWAVAATAVVSVLAIWFVTSDESPMPRQQFCRAQVGDRTAQLDLEQARWTSLMVAISQRRGLPPRAATIAIATAFQESKIHNINYGDRDSLGLFQQRPSQGWGTEEQVMDPFHAINRFYDGLVRVRGYESMPITEAAQAVQRSAFPGAYAAHEDYSRALASTLRGYSPAQFSCRVPTSTTGDPEAVVADLRAAYGSTPAAVDGETVTLDVTGTDANANVLGWAWAHYLVANAARLSITEVSFDAYRWSASSQDGRWVGNNAASAREVVAIVGSDAT